MLSRWQRGQCLRHLSPGFLILFIVPTIMGARIREQLLRGTKKYYKYPEETHHFLHRSANASRSVWALEGVAERVLWMGCGLALSLPGFFLERPV